jgi:uncharacterized membrane protein YciS (DUF1049 family)
LGGGGGRYLERNNDNSLSTLYESSRSEYQFSSLITVLHAIKSMKTERFKKKEN